MIKWTNRVWRTVRENPGVVLALLVGFILGVLFLIPLVPYHLPDSTANIVGAALGAAIAVVGAEIVSNRKDQRRRQVAAMAAAASVTPLLRRVRDLRDLVASIEVGEKANQLVRAAYESSREIPPAVEDFLSRLDFMTPLFQQMGGTGVIAFATLKNSAGSCLLVAEKTSWASMYDDIEALVQERDLCLARLEGCVQLLERGIETMNLPD